MTHSPVNATVSVALIRNPKDELLWTWDDEWGCFALPMSRMRAGESDVETPLQAAHRAAARTLGVPVKLGQHVALAPQAFVSGRDLTWRRYRYQVFKAEAHPDFADRVAVHGPHFYLPPHRAAWEEYEPINRSSRWIIATLVADGLIPGRSQYTAALVVERLHLGKRQFLLRLEADWGYALPTKRREAGESYAAAAERVAQEELGLAPGDLKLQQSAEAVVTDRERSRSEQTDTFYCHGVFPVQVPEAQAFTSAQPLVWADAATIASGRITDRTTTTGQKAPDAGVSPTARHILQELDVVPFLGEL